MTLCRIQSDDDINTWLTAFGYESLEQMQEAHDLPVTGQVTQNMLEVMERPRCGVSDFRMQADCKWGKRALRYWNGTGRFSLFHTEMGRAASNKFSMQFIDAGFQRWATVLPGFTFMRTFVEAEADMWIGGGNGTEFGFDGPGRILAWAEMPCGAPGRRICRFDMSEQFTNDSRKRRQPPWVFARSVWLHELGHLLGLDHSRNPRDLMAPYYNPDIVDLQPGDIQRIQKLYGITT